VLVITSNSQSVITNASATECDAITTLFLVPTD